MPGKIKPRRMEFNNTPQAGDVVKFVDETTFETAPEGGGGGKFFTVRCGTRENMNPPGLYEGNVVDGITLAIGDRVFMAELDGPDYIRSNAGIWVVNGTPQNLIDATRAVDFPKDNTMLGSVISIEEGGQRGGTVWYNNNRADIAVNTNLDFLPLYEGHNNRMTQSSSMTADVTWRPRIDYTINIYKLLAGNKNFTLPVLSTGEIGTVCIIKNVSDVDSTAYIVVLYNGQELDRVYAGQTKGYVWSENALGTGWSSYMPGSAGDPSTDTARRNTAFGTLSRAIKDGQAFGYGSNAYGREATALGRLAEAGGDYSVAIGDANQANAEGAIVIGHSSVSNAQRGIVVGKEAVTNSAYQLAMGYRTRPYRYGETYQGSDADPGRNRFGKGYVTYTKTFTSGVGGQEVGLRELAGGGATARWAFKMNSSAIKYTLRVLAINADGSATKSWEERGIVKYSSGGQLTKVVGFQSEILEDGAVTGWTINFAPAIANSSIYFYATMDTASVGNPVRVMADLEYIEISA